MSANTGWFENGRRKAGFRRRGRRCVAKATADSVSKVMNRGTIRPIAGHRWNSPEPALGKQAGLERDGRQAHRRNREVWRAYTPGDRGRPRRRKSDRPSEHGRNPRRRSSRRHARPKLRRGHSRRNWRAIVCRMPIPNLSPVRRPTSWCATTGRCGSKFRVGIVHWRVSMAANAMKRGAEIVQPYKLPRPHMQLILIAGLATV